MVDNFEYSRNVRAILSEIKVIPYKWWKKDLEVKRLTKEVSRPFGQYLDLPKVNDHSDLRSKDIKTKITYLHELKMYGNQINHSRYNHLLAINEEILEYIVEKLDGKDGMEELADILIFTYLYLRNYDRESKYNLSGINIKNDERKWIGFQFRWVSRANDFEQLYDLYRYCLQNVPLKTLIDKVYYNEIRGDHISV